MEKNFSIAVFFHNYYANDFDWIQFFSNEFDTSFLLFYNIVNGSYARAKADRADFPTLFTQAPFLQQWFLRASSNKGKDIGGKLILMDAYLKLDIKSEYLLFLHDKQSLHQYNGQQWKANLLRIAEKKYREKALNIFKRYPSVGIIASANAIRNEWDNEHGRNAYTNSELINKLKKRFNINPPNLQFVAGTMFWVRASLLENFFKNYSPLTIRAEMEEGNVMDDVPTVTHAWERMICWIVTAQGYQIKGI